MGPCIPTAEAFCNPGRSAPRLRGAPAGRMESPKSRAGRPSALLWGLALGAVGSCCRRCFPSQAVEQACLGLDGPGELRAEGGLRAAGEDAGEGALAAAGRRDGHAR